MNKIPPTACESKTDDPPRAALNTFDVEQWREWHQVNRHLYSDCRDEARRVRAAHGIKAALRAARKRYLRLPVADRPADAHDILTMRESLLLVLWGAYPLDRRHRAYVTGAGEAGRLRRLMRREIEAAVPSIVIAVSEALHRGK